MYAASLNTRNIGTSNITRTKKTQTKGHSVVLIGFHDNEKRLADAAIRLSQRRQTSLYRLDPHQVQKADVIIIDDAHKNQQYTYIENTLWFRDKLIIRVDSSDSTALAHSRLKRPVKWNNLPYIVALALEKQHTEERANTLEMAQVTAQPVQSDIKKILVVDDSETIRNHLSSLIQEKGLAVKTATSAKEAIDLFTKEDFDCVLMDVLMPELDGYEGCKRIKKLRVRKEEVPVIMLTSKSSTFDKIRGKLAGCNAYLTKPTTTTQLFSTIENLTQNKEAFYQQAVI